MLHLLPDLCPGMPEILLASNLPLSAGETLLFRIIGVVDRNEHLLNARKVGREILVETSRDKGSSSVFSGKESIHPPGAVDTRVCADVENAAVHGQVDREAPIGAIV